MFFDSRECNDDKMFSGQTNNDAVKLIKYFNLMERLKKLERFSDKN